MSDTILNIENITKSFPRVIANKKVTFDIKKNAGTSHIPCFLADWGYLKDSDRYNLSNEIRLLKLSNLEELVAI